MGSVACLVVVSLVAAVVAAVVALLPAALSAPTAFRRDPGHPQWHHSAFHDVQDSVRADVHHMLHTRAEVPFQVPLEVNVALIGFNGNGGFRYTLDAHKLENFLKRSFPIHRLSCFETGNPIDIEHHIIYNIIPAGQAELIAIEKAVKDAMVPAGDGRESRFGKKVPFFEVDAFKVEPTFQMLYSFMFDVESSGYSATQMDGSPPSAIFVVNFDKVRMDPRNSEIDHGSLMYSKISGLTDEQLITQDGGYVYHYRYNGGGASQVWLSSGRFVVIDISAGPCTYGKIETEEGSVSYGSIPRLVNLIVPRGSSAPKSNSKTQDIFIGQLGALISSTIEHVIAPDIRFETVALSTRLLVPIIVLQNHNRYNILQAGHNSSIDITEIEKEVKKLVPANQEVIVIGGSHALHLHEKLAIAVSKAMRSHSIHETKSDGKYHVRTKTFLDGAILKQEMERSVDVLAAGLLEMANPSLSNEYFVRRAWTNELDEKDSLLKHKPIFETLAFLHKTKFDSKRKPKGLYQTYGTRLVPVFVLSLADVDSELLMEDESLVWTSKDVVIVLQHDNEKIPLSYVSETTRLHAYPSHAQRHIMAGLASVLGGLSAPYERVSRIHDRPVLNWLWAAGCHPFGPFSNSSQISQLLQDASMRNAVYARVDAALRNIRENSEVVQSFASQHIKTPLGEPLKGIRKNKTSTELWIDKFYKKTTKFPEPFPHEAVENLEKSLDKLEERLVGLSSLLYDHKLEEAYKNSTEIFQSTILNQRYVSRVLAMEKMKMRCCTIDYRMPKQSSSQAFICGGILVAGFVVYFIVIFFSSPIR